MISEPVLLGRGQQRLLAGAVRRAFPREACGLLFARADRPSALIVVPIAPRRNTPSSFRIRARDVARLRDERETAGERLVGCYHSHVFSGARPSCHDRAGAARFGGLWLIHSLADGRTALFEWNGADFEPRRLQLL